MHKGRFVVVAALFALGAQPSWAADSLAQWVAGYSQPDIQRKILQRIFPEVDSSASGMLDKTEGSYLFPKGGSWVQLKKPPLWLPPASGNPAGLLIVTCLLRRGLNQDPLTASSYALSDTFSRAVPVSGGYATDETVNTVRLPNLKKSFLVFADSFAQGANDARRWNIFVADLNPEALGNGRPRTVWTSPMSSRYFQIGFTALRPDAPEELVMRNVAPPAGITGSYGTSAGVTETYTAYQWTGDRFEPDTTVFESQLKRLPDTIWQYGTGR